MADQPIIGHKKQLMQLKQDLESGNLAHAYLFAGAPHIGKMTVAHKFAKDILLQSVEKSEKELIETEIEKLIHPDLLVLDQLWMEERMEDWDFIAQSSNFPQQHRAKAGLKTDVIAIDDIREIQNRLQETGNLSHRVCIIRGIERMQDSAANAFLKILEEPPEGRIFILTTESLGIILPTVISRTRVLRFERAPDREIQTLLKDQSEEDISFITHVAQGAPGVALNLMNDPEALLAEKTLHAQATSFWGALSLHDKIKQLEPLIERGEDADRFLFHLALSLRKMPNYSHKHERAFMELIDALDTNTHRVLQMQKFAFACEIKN
jgi:DNA polymerase III subunit delta'